MGRHESVLFNNRRRAFPLALILTFVILAVAAAQQPAPRPASEPAVPPSLNEPWKSENIDPLVRMLEAESREIYVHRELLAALVGAPAGAAVADVGAGSGFMVELFARDVGPTGKVYAVDINPTMLELVERRAREDGVANIVTVLADEDHTRLPPNSVDIVFICDTYHHFAFPEATMRSVWEALRPGGQLIVVEFHRIPGRSPEWVFEHVRAGEEEFTREISSFGFALSNRHDLPQYFAQNYILRFRRVERPAARALPVPQMLPASDSARGPAAPAAF
jgi:ubiquinone/menaquinone biosynthesis C-methylase UbiE